tara:strand:+ start:806 stop:2104 length:1299 start_codon:yes stop_codon:yes gene_type:complete
MFRGWAREFNLVAFAAILSIGFGLAVGEIWLCLTFGIGLYLSFHLYQIAVLLRWLRGRRRDELPEAIGVWSDIFVVIHQQRERFYRRNNELTEVIKKFQQAAAATPDAAVVLNDSGAIEWLNAASASLLGLRPGSDVGQIVTDLVRVPAFSHYLSLGRFDEALEISCPGNDERILSIRVVLYGDQRRLLLARDVTRVHRTEQIRKDFVANVSHELRSPLTVIRGYVETIEHTKKGVPKEWQRPLEHVGQQTARMCRIVDDLLQLSRIESNPNEAGDNPVSITDLLESVRADAIGLTGDDLSIEIEADSTVQLTGDYNELYSAVSNLVFNAVQYTPVGERIDLRWYASVEGGHIVVRDHGIGIESHHLGRLTERFYRVDKARSRAVGGTGLGLAIVKHVLMRHGGELNIESTVGEGSSFQCNFPVARLVTTKN